ncbi:MAG: GTP 3',8-cyclase MoaA [Ignavibacteriales bacterium]|nr:GTP 3',8-cyclase MoaA [Ignavibacteriales bacterium]
MILKDNFGRVHDYVRISLIDKCNLCCSYCNPDNSLAKLSSKYSLLSYEELYRLVKILTVNLQVKKIRFTGGEPLIRKDIMSFFAMIYWLKQKHHFEIGITTNGTHLCDKIEDLLRFGIDRLNISLDTMQKNKYISITGADYFDSTIESIHKAIASGFKSVKVNCVLIKNTNDDELNDFVSYFKNFPIELRFIEYMPFSGNKWDDLKFYGWEMMKEKIEHEYILKEVPTSGKIAKMYSVAGYKLKLGFISSISNHFCDTCNRIRITATGQVKNCLFSSSQDIILKKLLADYTVSDDTIAKAISEALKSKWSVHPEVDDLLQLNTNNMMSIGG